MNGDQIFNSINNIQISIKNHKEEIEKLDQEIGDGDHIFNILRGLDEILNLKEELMDKPIDHIFKQLGMKIMTTVGGSSGALFATLLIGMSKKYNSDLNALHNLSEMFFEGVQSMKKRGKADVGEKTMMDVLIPVSNCLKKGVEDNKDVKEILKEAIEVAEKGMFSTKDLLATKGRASFLGERAKGHIDPGARSSQLMIKTVCESVLNS